MSLRTEISIYSATIREQARAEKAFLGNFWAELSSTAMFTLTFLVFVDLLFRRVGDIAGYSKNDFFLMMLLGQLVFYLVAGLLVNPMVLLVESVRNGYFDLMLLKPVRTRLYLYARAFKPLFMLFVSLPNLILYSTIIDWSKLDMTVGSILAGVLVWICGFIIFNTVVFCLTLPVFTQGDATDMLLAWGGTVAMMEMPYKNLPGIMKFFSLNILPGLLMTAGSAAVMLHKSPALPIVLSSIIAALVAALLFSLLWKYALRNYTSASS